jgi:BlaI family penicillinase repressor
MGDRRRPFTHLSRRETQIMEVLIAHGEASVEEVRRAMGDGPSYDSVRVILGILRAKGLVRHRKEGRKHIYRPKDSPRVAKRAAIRHLLDTFFMGSTPVAVSTLIDLTKSKLSEEELDDLAALIDAAREKRRQKETR